MIKFLKFNLVIAFLLSITYTTSEAAIQTNQNEIKALVLQKKNGQQKYNLLMNKFKERYVTTVFL